MSIRHFMHRMLSVPYERVFKERMSREASAFFLGTSYAAVGTVFGAALTLLFNVLGARLLGPEGYGNLNLVLTVSALLAISMGFGLSATIKYAAGEEDAVQRTIISTSSILVSVLIVVSVGIFTVLSAPFAQLLGIPVSVYLFAAAYAVTLTLFTLTMNILRIGFRMRSYAIFNAVQSTILLATFLIFIGAGQVTWQTAAYAILLANIVVSILIAIYMRRYLSLRFDRAWARAIARYSLITLPGAIALAGIGVDRLLINALVTTAAVGIYNAYFLPSVTIAVTTWGIFNATFFPYASKRNDRHAFIASINRAAPYVFLIFVPAVVCLERVAFVFYGAQYPFSWTLTLLFALAAATYMLFQSYAWLMASVGTSGAKVSMLGNLLTLGVLIALNVVLLPYIGLFGAAFALIAAYAIPIPFLFSQRRVLQSN
ncbi:MAG: oligosaccharide flippase family protein [Halobacteriota archaeon]